MLASFTLNDDYWEVFELQSKDVEFLYNHLLEIETPLSPAELVAVLIEERLRDEKVAAERRRAQGGKAYLPKDEYAVGDDLLFPALGGEVGSVTAVRPARAVTDAPFSVVEVEFESGQKREFAAGFAEHKLNIPIEPDDNDPLLNPEMIQQRYGELVAERAVSALKENDDFVYIAGRWFPRALLVDVNAGNLNLAEAILDMAEGGPLPTTELIAQVGMPEGVNQNLAEFSLDLALQTDIRFDEVGSAGEVAWFLKRLEPQDVLETPIYLRYSGVDYDQDALTDQMLQLETRLDDELSELDLPLNKDGSCDLTLIYPHWRSGTLPLSDRLAKILPTAYESPRVRFTLVDGETGEKFPGWVVRLERYVYGLREWYQSSGLMPGSKISLRPGENPGEVIVTAEGHRSTKEWVRTALVGADGGVVFATLKQTVEAAFDDWMMVYMASATTPLDERWTESLKKKPPFEQIVVETLRELARLNPQAHVHAAELYSAVNVVYRCPPGPVMALLGSRSWFVHIGDLHFRFEDTDSN